MRLTGANLSGAQLSSTNLNGAWLIRADVTGADGGNAERTGGVQLPSSRRPAVSAVTSSAGVRARHIYETSPSRARPGSPGSTWATGSSGQRAVLLRTPSHPVPAAGASGGDHRGPSQYCRPAWSAGSLYGHGTAAVRPSSRVRSGPRVSRTARPAAGSRPESREQPSLCTCTHQAGTSCAQDNVEHPPQAAPSRPLGSGREVTAVRPSLCRSPCQPAARGEPAV